MSNQIEIRHFRYFLAVAEELHFRKAAEKLFISQPGLSRQIKQMELLLNVKLIERSKKNVALTPAGEYFQKEIEFFLRQIDNVISHTQLLSSGLDGEIKMGFVGSAMQSVIPDLLLLSNKRLPGIRFSLDELSNTIQIEKLRSNSLDFGFIRLKKVSADLNVRAVYKETFSLVLPSDHPISEATPENIAKLKDEQFILFHATYSPGYFDKVMSICQDHGFSPQVAHNTVHANTIFRLVENKIGISIVPTTLQEGYSLNIKFVELKDISQRAILYIAWKRQNRNPSLAKVLEIVDEAYPEVE